MGTFIKSPSDLRTLYLSIKTNSLSYFSRFTLDILNSFSPIEKSLYIWNKSNNLKNIHNVRILTRVFWFCRVTFTKAAIDASWWRQLYTTVTQSIWYLGRLICNRNRQNSDSFSPIIVYAHITNLLPNLESPSTLLSLSSLYIYKSYHHWKF